MSAGGYRGLTPVEVREYKKNFDQFDLDGDGVVTVKELKVVFKNMGYRLPEDEIEDIVHANDSDGSGSLSFEEFIRAMSKNTSIRDDEHQMAYIRRKFLEVDTDNNGVVSLDEAHQILIKEFSFSLEQSKELVKKYDKNGDGELSYDEFAKFYSKVRSKANQIQEMFNEFDKDGSGSISISEARVMLRQLGIPDDEIKTLVAMYDTNNDGELQYEEFVSFLLHN